MLGPFRTTILPRGVQPPETPIFGVSSADELQKILEEYRPFVRRLIQLARYDSLEAIALCKALAERAKLQVTGLTFNRRTGLLTPSWQTQQNSFTEMLYAHLVLAFEEVSPRHLHECESCGKFFLDASRRRMSFCSRKCRNAELVRRYRERHPDKYRAYQRRLMRERYAAGKTP